MSVLTPATRPNGNVYKPRKPPRAVEVDNSDGGPNEPSTEIYVLGTHDIERAYNLATANWRGVDRASAELTWLRLAIRDGERCYDHDPVRGAAAVVFGVIE